MSDEGAATTCPRCGAALTGDPRFSDWCPECDWNVDPLTADGEWRPDPGRRAARERRREAALFDRLSEPDGPGTGKPGTRASRGPLPLGALALAGAVDLLTLALAAAGGWLLTGTVPEIILGGVVLLLVAFVWSRRGRPPGHRLDRGAAPTLYAVADRVAAACGARPVDVIAVDAGFDAGVSRVGPRRRRVLTLGLALWETLTSDQRLALLGREFALAAAGDPRRGVVVESAERTLSGWIRLAVPAARHEEARAGAVGWPAPSLVMGGNRDTSGSALRNTADMFSQVVLGAVGKAAGALLAWLGRLTQPAGTRAEYLADRVAARIASGRSAQGMVRASALLPTAMSALDRMAGAGPAGTAGGPGDLWRRFGVYMASVPDSERARCLRLARLRGTRADPRHPATHLRLAHLRTLDFPAPAVLVGEPEHQAVDRELTQVRAAVAADLGR